MNNYVYEFEGKLYLNITNRCSNNCDFCIRNGREGLEGNVLWLSKEPDFEAMKQSLSKFDVSQYREIVFCGFGEPTENLQVLLETAKYLKDKGCVIRLNTNGQGSLVNNRNIVPELAKVIDIISISLNASDSKRYQEICKSEYGEDSYKAIIDFTKKCVKSIKKVIMSVVDEGDSEENERCRDICNSCGASFRLRTKY